MRDALRNTSVAERLVLMVFALGAAVGFLWGLPGSDAWAADAISPRSCGLFAIAETYVKGHYYPYPPLHMVVLTVPSLPWIALAATRVGTGVDALGAELIKPLYMTGVEVSARLIAIAMGLGVVWNTIRLWTRIAGPRVGVGAGLVVATNAALVYYAHTGNLEIPYLFWTTWALVEIDRVVVGEPREGRAILVATAAVLTKDQAAGVLFLPLALYLVVLPWFTRRASVVRRGLVRGTLLAIVFYAVVCGAVTNPSGFRNRLVFLAGPGSQTWASYPRGPAGLLALGRGIVEATPHFTSWPVAAAALVGVALSAWSIRKGEGDGTSAAPLRRGQHARARQLLPLVAAFSFLVFIHVSARRTEDRFLLPVGIFVFPYAAVAFERAMTAWPRGRPLVRGAAVVGVALALLGVASMDATLIADPRYEAERYLAGLAPGTHIELLGGPIFLPRIPPQLHAVRPGVEPIAQRQQIAGVTELVDPAMDPRPRAPAAIVVATELSNVGMTDVSAKTPFGTISYRDPESRRLLRDLYDGSLGYARVFRATCSLPWPLECRQIHHSTGGELWIYAPRPDS